MNLKNKMEEIQEELLNKILLKIEELFEVTLRLSENTTKMLEMVNERLKRLEEESEEEEVETSITIDTSALTKENQDLKEKIKELERDKSK